jgi:hypothetical protein
MNCTIANNSAETFGGGIRHTFDDLGMTLQNVIVSGNRATAGGQDIQGRVSARFTLIQSAEGAQIEGKDNIVGQESHLTPLADHGGLTFTHALLPGSPAIDAGHPAFTENSLPSYDQRGRGFARIVSGQTGGQSRIDIGAFEYVPVRAVDTE